MQVGSLDSAERKLVLSDAIVVGFSEPNQLFFARNRNLMAQAFGLTRLQLIGDPMLVAEGVGTLGLLGGGGRGGVGRRARVLDWRPGHLAADLGAARRHSNRHYWSSCK